ncbi:MAG: LysM peptidoglycan-binding domain-containing protein [bacterium]
MKSRNYLFLFLILPVLVTGCVHDANVHNYGKQGPKYANFLHEDYQGIFAENGEEGFSPESGRRSLEETEGEQSLFQDGTEAGFGPVESTDAGESKASGYGSESSLASFYGPNGSLMSAAPIEEIHNVQEKQDKLDEALGLCQEAQDEWQAGNSELSLELLDRAYELLINVETNGDAEIFQQKEDIRFLISRRIVEIYASRQRVVNGKHTEIPLVMNDIVEREIKGFLGPERTFFLDSYARSGRFRPMILDELRKAGLPDTLSWLPLIESGFLIRALSRARALGLWQFIPSTGYKFGLERDRWIDERMDPVKATRAAIEYLTQLHHIFGDWTTALAAYNCGEGTVLRVIRSQHINYLDNFWDLYSHLPSETARYVPRFMAALHLIENPEQYGLELPPPLGPLLYEEITVDRQIQLSDLAAKIGVGAKELIDMNPELRHKVTPDSEYALKVPVSMTETALAGLDEIPSWRPPQPQYVYHRVRKGETLSHIAQRYRTNVRAIARANNIRRYNRLRIGQRLKIPVRKGSIPVLASAGGGGGLKTFTVRKGDCAYDIARMHGMRLNDFLSLNNLSRHSVIYPGQEVLVRGR